MDGIAATIYHNPTHPHRHGISSASRMPVSTNSRMTAKSRRSGTVRHCTLPAAPASHPASGSATGSSGTVGRSAAVAQSWSDESLIIRYAGCMRTITATEASRRFSDLLDAIERGETITITRGRHPVAEIGPARRRTGADLRAALVDITPPDDRFAEDIADALALVTTEERDPWADA